MTRSEIRGEAVGGDEPSGNQPIFLDFAEDFRANSAEALRTLQLLLVDEQLLATRVAFLEAYGPSNRGRLVDPAEVRDAFALIADHGLLSDEAAERIRREPGLVTQLDFLSRSAQLLRVAQTLVLTGELPSLPEPPITTPTPKPRKLHWGVMTGVAACLLLAPGWALYFTSGGTPTVGKTDPKPDGDRIGNQLALARATVASRPGVLRGGNEPARDHNLTFDKGLDRKGYVTVITLGRDPFNYDPETKAPLFTYPSPKEESVAVEPGGETEVATLPLPKSATRLLVVVTEKPASALIHGLRDIAGAEPDEVFRPRLLRALDAAGLKWAVVESVDIDPKDPKYRRKQP